MPTPALNAVVTQRIEVAPGLIILRVAPEGWDLPAFEPGQFAVIGLPRAAARVPLSDPEPPADGGDQKLIRRAYSIASSSVAREYLEFYITLVRSGELTPRLFALEAGSRLWLGPKITGLFTMRDVPPDRHVAMIATGTGLAPYMSMLRSEFACNVSRRFATLVGARHSWDLGYSAELGTIQRLCRNFAYLPIVSRPEQEPIPWGGPKGHVQSLWTAGHLERAWGFKPTPEDTHVFLCGNPAMIEDMTKVLEGEGFRVHDKAHAGQIHVEKYW